MSESEPYKQCEYGHSMRAPNEEPSTCWERAVGVFMVDMEDGRPAVPFYFCERHFDWLDDVFTARGW